MSAIIQPNFQMTLNIRRPVIRTEIELDPNLMIETSHFWRILVSS